MQNRLTQALDFQTRALVLRAERQQLIASNIANVDTPGYQAREMDFADALRQATGIAMPGSTATGTARLALATTSAGHEAASAPLGETAGLLYARHSQDAIDRNTVDMDRERASSTENTVKYEATLRFINGSVRSMLDAMKSHNQ
jgi:flagellar basal-body rod protein FlgB